MTLTLHCSRTLDKQLDALRRSGKKGKFAVNQCESILNTIRFEGVRCDAVLHKRTKNGEQRITNCVKYNLGHGYRLITVRRGDHLFVTFAGHHDRADQWLDQNRDVDFCPDDPGFESENLCYSDKTLEAQAESYASKNPEEDLYESYLQSQLNDELLRSIFSGLIRSSSGR
jgi:hypothetical protein